MNEFKVQQQYSTYSEWKDLDKTLLQLNLSDKRVIHIAPGTPLTTDEWNIV